MTLSKKSDFTIYSVSNFAYKDIALNWAAALKNIGVDNYRIYSVDEKCHNYLLQNGENSILWLESACEEFNSRLALVRYQIMESLLAQGLNAIYSDLDAIWIANPILDLTRVPNFDMYASTVAHSGACPSDIRIKWGGFTICTGWLALRRSCLPLIKDFIQVFKIGRVADQKQFNRYIDNKKNKFTKPPNNHKFTTTVGSLKILGLNENLIWRGNYKPSAKVCHIPTDKTASAKLGKLKKQGLYFLKTQP